MLTLHAAITQFRYHHIDCVYRDYVDYIARLIPHNRPLSPLLAKLLDEAHILYANAKSDGHCLDGYSVSSRIWFFSKRGKLLTLICQPALHHTTPRAI